MNYELYEGVENVVERVNYDEVEKSVRNMEEEEVAGNGWCDA